MYPHSVPKNAMKNTPDAVSRTAAPGIVFDVCAIYFLLQLFFEEWNKPFTSSINVQ
jgi:hypothetical protein